MFKGCCSILPFSDCERNTKYTQAVVASFVVVVEVPQDGMQQAATCVCQAFKEYLLHVQFTSAANEVSFLDPAKLTHYCDPTLEAAFTGVFLHEAALRMYCSLFHAKERDPFQGDTVAQNKGLLLNRARQEMCNSALRSYSYGSAPLHIYTFLRVLGACRPVYPGSTAVPVPHSPTAS